jgi:hypothetical protein
VVHLSLDEQSQTGGHIFEAQGQVRFVHVLSLCMHSNVDGRQIKFERQSSLPNSSENGHMQDLSYATTIENTSESEIPLAPQSIPMGYAAAPTHFHQEEPLEHYDTHLHAPKPQRPGRQIKPEEGLRRTPNPNSQISLPLTTETDDPFADSRSPPPSEHTRPYPTTDYPATQAFSTFVGSQEPASEFTPPRHNHSGHESTRIAALTFNNNSSTVTTPSPNPVQTGPHNTVYINSPERITENDDAHSIPLRQRPGVTR